MKIKIQSDIELANELKVGVDELLKYITDNYLELAKEMDSDKIRVNFSDGTHFVISKETKKKPTKFKLLIDNVSPEDIARFNSFTGLSSAKAPPKVIKSRMKICTTCDKYSRSEGKCTACGCGIKGKIMMSGSFCPERKWDKVRPE